MSTIGEASPSPASPENKSGYRQSLAEGKIATFWKNRSLNFWLWTAVVIFGVVQAIAGRFDMFSDGISYLDLSDAYGHGDWHNAINGLWSPLYPILLALTFSILHPSAYYEAPILHLLNLGIYLLCFASLQLLVREIEQQNLLIERHTGYRTFSASQLKILACLLFLLMAQHYNTVEQAAPDLLVVLSVFLASTLILRASRLGTNWRLMALLGLVLGFGYLAKAVVFTLAPVFIAAASLRKQQFTRQLAAAGVCLLAFGLVAGAYIYPLSKREHRLTFSDAAELNYIWKINGTSFRHLQVFGNPRGMPLHPTKKIFSQPDVYEFSGPITGSYPVWYDPTYWHEGLRPRFDWGRQTARIKTSITDLGRNFLHEIGLLFVWLLLAFFQSSSGVFSWRRLLGLWRIIVPSLAFFVVYIPIFVTARYFGGPFVVLALALYASIFLRQDSSTKHLFSASVATVGVAVALVVVPHFVLNLRNALRPIHNIQWEVAQGLQASFGLHEHDTAGCVDCMDAYWARLARVRIVVEVADTQKDIFMNSPAAVREAAVQTMLAAGAKVVVVQGKMGEGWRQIGNTGFFVYPGHRRDPG